MSDTHGVLDPAVLKYFEPCDEIWHAGDIGSIELLDTLKGSKPVRAVYGNIDSQVVRKETTETGLFLIEGVKVIMTHIGGRPPSYTARTKQLIKKMRPDIFICGHSHILLVQRDATNGCLYINPGACGNHGFHKKRTLIRFEISSGKPKGLEVIELSPRFLHC